MNRLRNLTANLTLVMASILVSLVFAEIAFRVIDLYPPPDPQPRRPHMFTGDVNFGYRLKSSMKTSYRYPPRSPVAIPLVSNSLGFRDDRELYETDPRTRILMVGDSFIFGSGVFEEQRISEVLESLEPAWRVDSVGMPGWGIDSMVRALEHILPNVKLDTVILAVYCDDFRRVHPYYAGMGYAVEKYDLVAGQLVSRPFPTTEGMENLRIWQAAYRLVTNNYLVRDHFDINGALLERFLELSGNFSFDPVILFLPGKTDTPIHKRERKFLGKWTADRNIPYLDLTPIIHGAGVVNTYIADNWHWNPNGHRIAAEAVHEFLNAHHRDQFAANESK
jgi:hypothetical protein